MMKFNSADEVKCIKTTFLKAGYLTRFLKGLLETFSLQWMQKIRLLSHQAYLMKINLLS